MAPSIDDVPVAATSISDEPTTVSTADTTPTDPDAIPDFTIYTAETDSDRHAALKLIADSIAQQRQTASRALISHPLHLALFVAICATVGRYLYLARGELGIALSTVGGLTMASLALVRYFTGAYINFAEAIHEDLLDEREVVVARYGEEVMAAAVWGWVGGAEGRKKKPPRRAEVVAWTTRLRYRGKGVGVGVLEKVVDEVKAKGGDSVVFVDDHANSKRLLWNYYNGVFDRREKRGRQALQATWESRAGAGSRRKR